MQSRTGAVTQVSILPQSFFLLLPYHFFAIAASFFLLLPHHFFFSSTLKAQKFSCYPTVTNPTAKGDNDINRRLYILTIRVICSQKDHQKESDIGEERFLQKLLFTTRYTCFHNFQPFFCSANCNEKIAAPRRTRVTNSTKICRTSLVARYAAPPALRVTRQHILPVRYYISSSRSLSFCSLFIYLFSFLSTSWYTRYMRHHLCFHGTTVHLTTRSLRSSGPNGSGCAASRSIWPRLLPSTAVFGAYSLCVSVLFSVVCISLVWVILLLLLD